MAHLRTRLPPMNSLVAFEASARLLSFTRAGEELRVSREAISRQIRNLESHLGRKLFTRSYRALTLTRAGVEFEAVVRQSLESVARSSDALRGVGSGARVTVTATIAIASHWLTPRLARFRAAHPEAEIRVVVSDAPGDMASHGIDVGLRYGDGRWPGVEATHLFDVVTFPVCAPDYAGTAPAIGRPADLVAHTLLNLDGPAHAGEDWTWWLDSAGVTPRAPLQILGFDSYANVIQAARDGQGVALGFGRIVGDLLARGDLVRPIDRTLSKGCAVYLVAPAGLALSPVARDFFDWIRAEAA
jgi:LysR family glycine cleavage system transcriptional activator